MASKPWLDKDRGVWYCKYRPDPLGPWIKQALGKHPVPFSKDRPPKKPPDIIADRAEELRNVELRAKLGLGVAAMRIKSLEVYIADFLVAYREGHVGATIDQVERHTKNFVAFAKAAGVNSLQGVTRATCRTYLEQRFAAGAAHNTLVTEKGYLAGVWSQAMEDRLISENPWKGVKPPGKPAELEWTFWPDDDIRKIAAHMMRPWQADFVLILGSTGLRISTALAMTWVWIDWGQGVINIPEGEDIKTQYPHVMGPEARNILERRQMVATGNDLVFPNPYKGGGIISSDTVRNAIKRSIRLAGVKYGTPHDLRHSYARNLVLDGVPITVVQKQLGHATLNMTMRYCTADQENVRSALEKLAERRLTPPAESTPRCSTDQ